MPAPAFTGVRVLDNFPLATLRDFIDWSPFFHTWGLKGIYPRIFEHPEQGEQARQLFTEANALLDRIIEKKLITARGVYGFFPANAVGDDVELYTDDTHDKGLERFHFLRQQANREGSEPCRSLADFIAPKETGLPDHIGAFAVTSGIGLKELCDKLPRRQRRLQRHHGRSHRRPPRRSLRRMPAQARPRRVGLRLRRKPQPEDSSRKSIAASVPPPATRLPRPHREGHHSGVCSMCRSNTGMQITESFAMWPGSSVSGLYFAHPESRYFSLGKIDRDQVADYHRTQGNDRGRGRALARAEPELRPSDKALHYPLTE